MSTTANERVASRYAVQHEVEAHMPDGNVYGGRDYNDVSANLRLQAWLRRRAQRGRNPMIAELLGFFEGAAAVARGTAP